MPLLFALPSLTLIELSFQYNDFIEVHFNNGSVMLSAHYSNSKNMNASHYSDSNSIWAIEVLQNDQRRIERECANSPIFKSLKTSLYTSLDTQHPEIRLIQLLPELEGEPIERSLTVHWLNNAPQYETVLYVWGDLKQTAHILISERQQKVIMNLYAFLKLQNATEVHVLWINALCINQNNTLKKIMKWGLWERSTSNAT